MLTSTLDIVVFSSITGFDSCLSFISLLSDTSILSSFWFSNVSLVSSWLIVPVTKMQKNYKFDLIKWF